MTWDVNAESQDAGHNDRQYQPEHDRNRSNSEKCDSNYLHVSYSLQPQSLSPEKRRNR